MRPTAVLPEATACHRPRKESSAYQAPPLHPRTPHGWNMWFSGFSAKSKDGLYLEAQKCYSWIQTAFVIMYEFEYSRPRTFDRARIFGQVVPVQQAGKVRQRRRPYKLGGLREDPTWGLHGGEATPPERELFSQTEKESEVGDSAEPK